MNYFAELFNSCETCPNLKMYPITEETFIDDGEFVDENTGNSFLLTGSIGINTFLTVF